MRQEGRTKISASVGLRGCHERKVAQAVGRAAGRKVKINKRRRRKKRWNTLHLQTKEEAPKGVKEEDEKNEA